MTIKSPRMRLSPSSAFRWMGCPASVKLIRELNLKDMPSNYADAGTRAHKILEVSLQAELSPIFL